MGSGFPYWNSGVRLFLIVVILQITTIKKARPLLASAIKKARPLLGKNSSVG